MGKRKNSNHLDDFVEWQESQYTPWSYYSKGKRAPDIEAVGSPKLAAIFWFAQAVLVVVVGTAATIGLGLSIDKLNGVVTKISIDISETWPIIPVCIMIAFGCLILGWRYWQKYKAKKQAAKNKRSKKRKRKK